jgi:hypothetical protein
MLTLGPEQATIRNVTARSGLLYEFIVLLKRSADNHWANVLCSFHPRSIPQPFIGLFHDADAGEVPQAITSPA